MYHYMSTFTGEIHEGLPEVVTEVLRTVKHYWKPGIWSFADVIRYAFCWKYSRAGF